MASFSPKSDPITPTPRSLEELRWQVASAMGWFDILKQNGGYEGFRCQGALCRSFVPDYPRDLNACAEAIATLNEDELYDYAYHLYQIARGNHQDKDIALIKATAVQQCEAFVATKSLTSKPDGLKINA